MGVLAILYIEFFTRLWGCWRRFIQSVLIGYGGFGAAQYTVFSKVIGVLATLYIECFLRLQGFLRRFIQSFALLGYWGFGNALYRVFYQVIGVLVTLYIQCFIRLWGFWRPFINCYIDRGGFIQSVLFGYWGFGNALYRVIFLGYGVLATLYIECFIRLLGFWRRFLQSVLYRLWGFWQRFIQSVFLALQVMGGFGDALYRVF